MKASKFGAVSLTDPRHKFELCTPGFGSVPTIQHTRGTVNCKGDLALHNKNYHQGE